MAGLFVGSEEDYLSVKKDHPDVEIDYIVHACKEPYHRAMVGYTGRSCDKDHPEYLCAVRWNEMAVNLVDAAESKYFDLELIQSVVRKICTMLGFWKQVLLHCNQWQSRAPGIAFLVLLSYQRLPEDNIDKALVVFQQIYPNFEPGKGMINFIRENWKVFTE